MQFSDADGSRHEIRCDFLVGADGSRSMCRRQLPESQRRQFAKEYPFAWFGIITEAPRSAPELVYAHSAAGFALINSMANLAGFGAPAVMGYLRENTGSASAGLWLIAAFQLATIVLILAFVPPATPAGERRGTTGAAPEPA